MRRCPALVLALFFLSACESDRATPVQAYRDDGTPAWVGETFTNPEGLWAGHNDEEGFYAWGEASGESREIVNSAAELDAKARLLDFIIEEGGHRQKNGGLFGVRRVDRFVSESGTVYVLVFVSKKNAQKSLF